ncbi:rRNA-binding ribosome biosynthesis protein rpf2 [Spiromyces aspiralis]|uniref:rRNA-binding ribosome biosynthesis protein rpf2 n=1 Tax=Spiromyces aspiralis TaxID=68401 RepID=A0ACC1HWH1_9FUNG|nr:rRNA-binding ribosome biosynthesis protein rpf2 [Spiromyces aspiralis]
MLRITKPKNARSKRALKVREAKVVENPKTAIFVRGSQTSQPVLDLLKDFYALKRTNAINFSKKNQIHPFDDETTIEFFSRKNDASLFAVGLHSKKRPHNFIIGRTFDYQVLDMMELGIENLKSISEFGTKGCAVGMKPLMIFNGEAFNQSEELEKLKNLLLDFFHGETSDQIALEGLEYVISVTAGPPDANGDVGRVYFRTYLVRKKKSGVRQPRVELEEMGPSVDFVLRRSRFALDDVWKQATKVPKELKERKVKNVSYDGLGDKYGRIHMGNQQLDKIQTRKVKALKSPNKRAAEANAYLEDGDQQQQQQPLSSKKHKPTAAITIDTV